MSKNSRMLRKFFADAFQMSFKIFLLEDLLFYLLYGQR